MRRIVRGWRGRSLNTFPFQAPEFVRTLLLFCEPRLDERAERLDIHNSDAALVAPGVFRKCGNTVIITFV